MALILLAILLYSGESMENALRACCKGIKIGKILIHRDGDDGKHVRQLETCSFGKSEFDILMFVCKL